MKIINRIAIVVLALVAFAMTSCQKDPLDAAIEAFKAKCPISITSGISCSDAAIDGTNVVFRYDINEDNIMFDAVYDNLENTSPKQLIKEIMGYNEEGKALMVLIEEYDKGVVNKYVGTTGTTLDFEIGLEDIEAAVGKKK
ncbi:MAG: hypothetical protein MJZ31_03450 [Bacteroidales bacterium]|nr:hypothetical protein [Bacteroidales bacterium]